MNPSTFRNMTPSEKERYAYLHGFPCAESRAELVDAEETALTVKAHITDAMDYSMDEAASLSLSMALDCLP